MGARIAMMRLGRKNRREQKAMLDFTMDHAIRGRPVPATMA